MKYGMAMSWAMMVGCATVSPEPEPIPTDNPSSPSVLGLIGDLGDKALTALGMKAPVAPDIPEAPKVPDSALPDRRIAWRVFASESLNVDDQGRSLALIVRLYKLKSPDAFLAAPIDTFGDPAKEKTVLSDDLISVRELQLLPGQHYVATEKVAREARYVGIVALYRKPAQGRSRYAFSAGTAERSGLSLGAHACAMSVQIGEAIGQAASTVRSVAVPCP